MKISLPCVAAACALSLLSPDLADGQDLRGRLGELAQSTLGDRLTQLEERLRARKDEIVGRPRPDRLEDLLEEQATDLTEHRSIELEGWSPDGLSEGRARECSRARAEREREMRTRREELGRARESLASAANETEEANARARLARQREHLHRELGKSEEILARVCGAEPPGLRDDFVPPGRESHPVFGEYFRKGRPDWAGRPEHPDHPRNQKGKGKAAGWNGDESHPDHPQQRKSGKKEKKGKGRN